MKTVTFFSFFALNVFSSFSSFKFPQNLNLKMYSVFFSLSFSFVWVLSYLEKVFQLLLYLQPSQLALHVSKSPSLPLSSRPVSLSEFTTGGIKFGWRWFSCSESLLELFCDIVEILLKLDRSLHEQSRKRMEDWATRWDQRVKHGKRSIRSTEILWNKFC